MYIDSLSMGYPGVSIDYNKPIITHPQVKPST